MTRHAPPPALDAGLDDATLRTEIEAAAARCAGYLRETPVMHLEPGAFGVAGRLTLKLEQTQHTGSFKARGAFNSLLSQSVPEAGVIAASGGNHGAAVAFAARALGHRAEIFVPSITSALKLARLRDYGAEVFQIGDEYVETLEACELRRRDSGALSVHAYDQPFTVFGQGTCGREFQAQAPDLDTVLVAVGGGGLIGGMAGWYQGAARIVAVESTGTATLYGAMNAGQPVDVAVSGVCADALGARRIGRLGHAIAERHVSHCVLVDDEAVITARRALWQTLRLAVEPAAASVLAALMSGAFRAEPEERIGLLLCGANADPATL